MDNNGPLVTIIILCIFLSSYFSATETAFSSANKIKLKNLAGKGNKRADLVLRLSERYDKLISTILIGNNIVNILASSLATILFIDLLGEDKGPTVATIILTFVVLLFGEITPKTLAKQYPETFAMFSAPIINLFMKILIPFVFLFSLWNKLLEKIFKVKEDTGITEEELLTIVEEAESSGNIDIEDKELIETVIEFNDVCVGDIYTPRVDIASIDINTSKEDILNIFKETAFSRLPVYGDSIDNVVGILNYKDFYNLEYEHISEILKPTVCVIKSKKINDLLKELQKEKIQIAVVINEFGETIGIVTVEDILEELVGEIYDEHDEVEELVTKVKDDEYIISGYASLHNLTDVLEIENDNIQTVSGFVMELFERIPEEKEIFENEKMKIEVLSMNNRRIEQIRLNIKEELVTEEQ